MHFTPKYLPAQHRLPDSESEIVMTDPEVPAVVFVHFTPLLDQVLRRLMDVQRMTYQSYPNLREFSGVVFPTEVLCISITSEYDARHAEARIRAAVYDGQRCLVSYTPYLMGMCQSDQDADQTVAARALLEFIYSTYRGKVAFVTNVARSSEWILRLVKTYDLKKHPKFAEVDPRRKLMSMLDPERYARLQRRASEQQRIKEQRVQSVTV